jgi:hypothetical protein
MSPEDIKLNINQEAQNILSNRAVLEGDIKQVICKAEQDNEKLYCDSKFLAKMRIGEATFYVVYSVEEDNHFNILTAYTHRSQIASDI